MKIVHIITSLGDGGAEHTLFKICTYDKFNIHVVISLTNSGKYYKLLKRLGVEIYYLKANFFSIYKFFYLLKLLRSLKPNVVQTWLVHADFIGGIAARLVGIKNIFWNIRYSNFKTGKTSLTTILIVKILAKLSFVIPKLIISVSKKAKKIYEMKGFDKKKLKVISNGYDLSILKPNKFSKINFKKKIKIKKKIPLLGNIARYDPKKDHLNLLNALSLIRLKNLDFFCVLVGSNIDKNNFILNSEIKKLNLSNYVKLLGQKDNILQVINGLDVYVQSSSYGEGFPNVVAESMACGVPCIATDVGDSSFIIGKTGWLVPPNNPAKLAEAIEKSLVELNTINWNKRCYKARSRIKKNFNVIKMLRLYNKVWNKIYYLN